MSSKLKIDSLLLLYTQIRIQLMFYFATRSTVGNHYEEHINSYVHI